MASIDFVPSIENVLDSEDISWDGDGNRLASWEINGSWQWVLYTELRRACEIAYDAADPNWPGNVKIAVA